tara:strand:+ start:1077 stop:1706 length:630 start_codon:yes stop_codon:yes gene_type:complete
LKIKFLKSFILTIVVLYLGWVSVLYILQRHLIYHPTTFDSYDTSALLNQNVVVMKDGDLQWLFLPAPFHSNKVLVYFHGNGGNAIGRIDRVESWRQAGFDVILAEYPGYGPNSGKPAEEDFYRSGRRIIDKTLNDFPNVDLYLYGESIGSGTAVQMATEYDEIALIIECGFSSLTDIVQSKYPIIPTKILLKDKFDNISKINRIDSYLL